MQCYSELLPPSGVTDSLAVCFTSPQRQNLVVAKTSLLQIFDLTIVAETEQAKLSLVAEYALQGTISALAKVTLLNSKSGGDALLIAFRDAKLSLIEWDPSQHSISTISIHYYENHDLLLCPWSPDLRDCVTHLSIDPSSRCAAFNFNVNSLAIIPFHQATDDLAMDDLDDLDDLDDHAREPSASKDPDAKPDTETKLFAPSFVLQLSALDPALQHPVAMTFLHEYREPTLGILYSTQAASMNTAPERKDVLAYAVYTLDVEQKASTTLLSVKNLPNDLHQVFSVPGPIGGTLLIGGNEIIHIDQAGRHNAVGVNEFSKQCTAFPLADQSTLELRLEGARLQFLHNSSNDVILVLNNGHFLVLSFRLDGRSVSALTLRPVDPSYTSEIFSARCSTIAALPQGHIFLGSEEADSVLIGTEHKLPQLKRSISRSYLDDTNGDLDLDESDEDDDDDDDDIYADTKPNATAQQGALEGPNITLKDRLHCLAPLQDVVVGRPPKRKRDDGLDDSEPSSDADRAELVASCNRGTHGSLAFLSRALKPRVVKRSRRPGAAGVWAMSTDLADLDPDARPFDDLLVVSEVSDGETHHSSLLSLAGDIEEKLGTDFEEGDRVIATGMLATGSYVVVYSKDVRTYNKEFGLDQIFAIVDEDADATAEVVAATVTDTHILLVKTDSTISLLKTDKSGDLDEVDFPDEVPAEGVISACLYNDEYDFFGTRRLELSSPARKCLILAVLTSQGALSLHPLPNLAVQVFHYMGVNFLPTYLSQHLQIPKHWRRKDDVTEMVVCNLGSMPHTKPYLILRTRNRDVTLYEPYATPDVSGSYRFIKVGCDLSDAREDNTDDETEEAHPSSQSMIPMHDVGGQGVLFVTGRYPSLVVKTPTSMPHVHRLDIGSVTYASPFHDSSCNRGLVYADAAGDLTFCEVPNDVILEYAGWAIDRVEINEEVTGLTYYPRTGAYILATAKLAPFHLPRDDEWHPEWEPQHEKATERFLPTSRSCSLKLISSSTHSIISQHHFGPDEQILSVKCMSLEISEQTHERKDLIVVGTGIARGENVVTRGNLYLFDIVDVVPHPDIPETDLKLKLITKEDVRGAVSAISSIGTQGFVLAAQGQKCMVRGLREDNAILPVAFMDMRYCVSVAKELPGTGLTILADAFSGLWILAYSEEPYKMQLIARDLENPGVMAAEFVPQDKQLYIIASDGNGELRILQYDPWNPKTERGSILLHKSTFNTGYLPSLMTLLPRAPTPSEVVMVAHTREQNDSASDSDSNSDMQVDNPPLPSGHQVLIITKEGALAAVTPISELSYRRLSTLQNVLTTQLEQPCGLNPRAHRAIETDGVGGRAMIDGEIVKRWLYQSSQHKFGLADRVGGSIWEVRADLEIVMGAGLGYL